MGKDEEERREKVKKTEGEEVLAGPDCTKGEVGGFDEVAGDDNKTCNHSNKQTVVRACQQTLLTCAASTY